MRVVAEGLGLRLAASAEPIGFFHIEPVVLAPVPGLPLLVRFDDLPGQRDAALHLQGPVLRDGDAHLLAGRPRFSILHLGSPVLTCAATRVAGWTPMCLTA